VNRAVGRPTLIAAALGLCGPGHLSLVWAGHSRLEENHDHRDAQLPAEARLDPGSREAVRRGIARPGQGIAARRLLSHRRRPAEPDHSLLAVRESRRAHPAARRSNEAADLAAEDP